MTEAAAASVCFACGFGGADYIAPGDRAYHRGCLGIAASVIRATDHLRQWHGDIISSPSWKGTPQIDVDARPLRFDR